MAKVLLKALDMLALFEHERPEWAEHEIARELGLPTSTAHRILRTLETRGYVARTPAGRYLLGPVAADLGRRATEHGLARSMPPALEHVVAETRATAVLGMPDPAGRGLLILDRKEPGEASAAIAAVARAVKGVG